MCDSLIASAIVMGLRCRPTLGLSGAGPRALKCKQDAPSRVHSRPFVRRLHFDDLFRVTVTPSMLVLAGGG